MDVFSFFVTIFLLAIFIPGAFSGYQQLDQMVKKKDLIALPTKNEVVAPAALTALKMDILSGVQLALDQKVDKPYKFKNKDFALRINERCHINLNEKTSVSEAPVIDFSLLLPSLENNSPNKTIEDFLVYIAITNCKIESDCQDFHHATLLPSVPNSDALEISSKSNCLAEHQLKPGNGTKLPDVQVHCPTTASGPQELTMSLSLSGQPSLHYVASWNGYDKKSP